MRRKGGDGKRGKREGGEGRMEKGKYGRAKNSPFLTNVVIFYLHLVKNTNI